MTDNAIAPPPAPLPARLASMLYDALLALALLFIAAIPFLKIVGDASAPGRRLAFQLYLLAVLYGYFAVFWVRGGQTLAMKTWRIRLVDVTGAPIGLGRAALRFMLALAGLALFGVTIVWALFDRDRQFLHDRLAGTRLVRVPR